MCTTILISNIIKLHIYNVLLKYKNIIKVNVNLMEEKLVYKNLDYQHNLYEKSILYDRDNKERANELIFNKMIELINRSRSYMLGPEKASAARFISKHYMDVYRILKEIMKKESNEI